MIHEFDVIKFVSICHGELAYHCPVFCFRSSDCPSIYLCLHVIEKSTEARIMNLQHLLKKYVKIKHELCSICLIGSNSEINTSLG